MKSDIAAIADAPPDSKATASDTAPARGRRGKRQSAQGRSTPALRFFLSKSENNGVPILDREFANESEGIIETLKSGKTYFVVSEWKGLADVSKKMPLIRKEVVTSKKHNLQ